MLKGVLDRIRALRRTSPSLQPEIRHVRLGNVTANVNIHAPEEMLKISTVWRCVSLVSNSVATLPWHVRRTTDKNNSEILYGHQVERILNRRPNGEMTPFLFRQTVLQHKLLYGNFYGEIERNGRGQAVAIWPIAPDRVDPCRDPDGMLYFRVANPRGGIVEMDAQDVFHVPGMGWDGIRGYSILEVAMQSLGAAYAMDRFAGRFFGQGMMPSGVLQIPDGLNIDADGIANLRRELKEAHAGWDRAQEPLILDKGMTYESFGTDPEKGQFLDTRKFTVFDACRWFGVPPYLAFASDEEARANVETQSREFLMYGLDPHIVSLQQEADRKLFQGFSPNLHTRMNVDEFQRGDLRARADFYTAMRHLGVFTVNDILRIEGHDTIGAEGDVRVMQVQFQPIGEDGAPRPIPDNVEPERVVQDERSENPVSI